MNPPESSAASAAARGWASWEPGMFASREKVGMVCFLGSEVAFFGTLIVTYLLYLGKSASGPTPSEALRLPLVIMNSVCLLSSSLTIVLALRAFRADHRRRFFIWLAGTMLLGLEFLAGTAYEWADLIVREGLLPRTNLFGTTFYTLIGFHAAHVSIGLIAMAVLMGLTLRGRLSSRASIGPEMLSWYWHFVDGVWIVIFTTVYIAGR